MTAYYCLQCRERRPGPGRCRVCGSSAWTRGELRVILNPRDRERFIKSATAAFALIGSSFAEVADNISLFITGLFQHCPELEAYIENSSKAAGERSVKEREG